MKGSISSELIRQTFRSLRTPLKRATSSGRTFHFKRLPVSALEESNVCPNQQWREVLRESWKTLRRLRPEASYRTFSIDPLLKRLRTTRNADEHLIECFAYLGRKDDSTLQWPGIVSILFSKAASDYFPLDSSVKEDVCRRQFLLVDVLDQIHCRDVFNKEHRRIQLHKKEPLRTKASYIVNNYFSLEAVRRIGQLQDSEATSLMASTMESFASSEPSLSNPFRHYMNSLSHWESSVMSRQGLLVANGCKAAMQLTYPVKKYVELAFQFGRYLSLATRANTDIQRILNYGDSITSTFSTDLLPVVLHLRNHPETLAYLHSCEEPLKNADFGEIYSAMQAANSIEGAKKTLNEYVRTGVAIISEFKDSESAKKLMSLTQTLNNFDE